MRKRKAQMQANVYKKHFLSVLGGGVAAADVDRKIVWVLSVVDLSGIQDGL